MQFTDTEYDLERCDKFLSPLYWKDINLQSLIYTNTSSEFLKLYRCTKDNSTFLDTEELHVGDKFGPSWSHYWIPNDEKWVNKELHFAWNSNCEVLIFKDGIPAQGLTGGEQENHRHIYILTKNSKGNEKFELYLEVSCNGLSGIGNEYMISPPDPNRYYTLEVAEIKVFNPKGYKLYMNFLTLYEIAKNNLSTSTITKQSLNICNYVMNHIKMNSENYDEMIEITNKFLNTNGIANRECVYAVGNCHIDSAWLWRFCETIKKVARSYSTALELMKYYEDYKFTASQIQHLEWMEEYYPELFIQIKEKIKEGKFIIEGGLWTEMDGNIPNGESFCKQILYGQNYVKDKFGFRCKVCWLPDTFGYSPQLPQIILHGEMKYFLTQKLSWSLINKFPHNSFYWDGIDGSEILVHFPPADTYSSQCTISDIMKSTNNNKDNIITTNSILLYGNGDGGGGPTRDMIERINTVKDLNGLPLIKYSTPFEFFTALNKDYQRKNVSPSHWRGELYLELHQGTFTSQALCKKNNRKIEYLYRNVELLSLWNVLLNSDFEYPHEIIHKNMKQFLLTQFHDVLPGTCIHEVYEDVKEMHEKIIENGNKLVDKSVKSILENQHNDNNIVIFNSNITEVNTILEVNKSKYYNGGEDITILQKSHINDNPLIPVLLPSLSFSSLKKKTIQNINPSQYITINQENDEIIVIENQYLKIKISSKDGKFMSVIDKDANNREIIINDNDLLHHLVLYNDIPFYWDAWDIMPYYKETGVNCNVKSIEILEKGPLRICIKLNYDTIGEKSSLIQKMYMYYNSKIINFENEVDWNESHKLLKAEFTTPIHSFNTKYDIAYGYIERPTHSNTSWDKAKYEVCGHNYMSINERGYSISILNDCKYGMGTRDRTMHLSLLRSPKLPDPECDMGKHHFWYGILLDNSDDIGRVVKQSEIYNNKPIIYYDMQSPDISCSFMKYKFDDSIYPQISCIKLSEDSKYMIIRIAETSGGSGNVSIELDAKIGNIYQSNILEDIIKPLEKQTDSKFNIYLYAFQLITIAIEILH